jgi:O-acetylhomoserine/O-acetylserine sulfhydrylase
LIRISVGTEHIDDIIADFEQSFNNAATKPKESGDTTKANVEGNADAPTKPTV